MDVKIRTEKTYCIEVTESQARDLLNVACLSPQNFPNLSQIETLNNLRQTLLTAGLTKDPE